MLHVFFQAHVQNCLISTSGLKSDVAVLFFDPDFLQYAGIPAIREHQRQKLCGFSGPFRTKWRFRGAK